MSFRLCDPARGEECADKDKIRNYFDGKKIQLIYTDTYIDTEDSTDTIKVYVEDKVYFPIDTSTEQSYDIFIK